MDNSDKTLSNRIRRVVILGHSGFIGSRLERFFRAESPAIDLIGRSYPDFDLTQEEDVAGLAEVFDASTVVILLSWIKRQFGDNRHTFQTNLTMAGNLCTLLEQHPVGRLVFFSSAAVYGEDIENTNITEETPVCPRSYYGASKFAAEFLLRKAVDCNPKSTFVVVRPPTVYGPGENGAFYGPTGFLRAVIDRQPIVLWGDGTEKREFIFVDDLVSIVHSLTFHSYDGVLNVVAGKSYTFVELIEILSRLVGREFDVQSRARTKGKVDNAFSNRALKKLFPDFCFTELEQGMKLSLEHHCVNVQGIGS